MKINKYYVIAIVGAILFVAVALLLRHQRMVSLQQMEKPTPAPWAVATAVVHQGDATQGFPAVAIVKGMNDIAITPRLTGLLLSVKVREGSFVKEGQQLAVIDTQELEQQLKSLIATKQSADIDAKRKQRDAQRAVALLKTKGISQAEAEQLQASAQSAQERVASLANQIKAAKTHIAYATITAPFDGYISARLADAGDFASIGKPIFRLISSKGARLIVRLPSNVLEQVTTDTNVELSHSAKLFTTKVTRIFPSVDEKALGHIEIDLANNPFGLSPGTLLHARIITKALKNTLLIPYDALLPQQAVYKVLDHKLQRIAVKPLLKAKEGIAVESKSLNTGDTVVVAHETQLLKMQSGDAITLMEPPL